MRVLLRMQFLKLISAYHRYESRGGGDFEGLSRWEVGLIGSTRGKVSLGGGSGRVVLLEDAALVGAVSVGTRWSLGKNLPGWGVGPGGSVQGSSP